MPKPDIIEYAKELFLTPNDDGEHKFSLREIAGKIRQKFDKKLTHQTIANWAKKYGWERLWEEGQRYGILEAVAKAQDEQTKTQKTQEEIIKEQIAKTKRDKLIMDLTLVKLSYKFIIEQGFTSIQEAIRVYEVASRNLSSNDLIEKVNDEVQIIIAKELLPDAD